RTGRRQGRAWVGRGSLAGAPAPQDGERPRSNRKCSSRRQAAGPGSTEGRRRMRRLARSPRWALEALEPLVLVSAVLAGPHARTLLDGLFAPLAAAAVTRLARLE